jgi:DNA-binding winged helix-turn-helix (wHTH) protein/tetratricopeptide (TPR) repeat protein
MRSLTHWGRPLRFGVYETDLRSGQLRKHGVHIKLQDQPFQILGILLKHPGELVTREELRHELWADHTFVDFDRSLNTAVTKLRLALCDSAENPRFIETVPRRGYRFIAPVSTQGSPGSPDQISSVDIVEHPAAGSGELKISSARIETATWRPATRLRRFCVIFAILVVVACLGEFYSPNSLRPQVLTAPPLAARHSVVVLGFKNLTGDSNHAWLSTALSDWLSAELAAGDQLRTIPEENVARMKLELALPEVDSLSQDTLGRIRQNLGSDWVVIGSYANLGNTSGADVRVEVRLQDTATGETVATISETGSESHLFDLISQTGEQLRAKLNIQSITPQQQTEVAVTLPSNRTAARLYAEGLNKLRTYDALAAHDLLLKAIAIEPNDALPHSALASAWSKLGHDATAVAEAKKASDLSSSLSRAERSLIQARYYEVSHNWQKAIETYQLLFDFFPDRIDYGLALVHAQVMGGKGKDAEVTVLTLRKLPMPLGNDPGIDLAEAEAADSQGDLKKALTSADKGEGKARSIGDSVLLAYALTRRADELRGLGRLDESAAAVNESKQLFARVGDKDGFARAQAMGAHLLSLQGDFAGAIQTYQESLSTFRAIGDRDGVARELNNIGAELQQLGDLSGARRNFEEALATWSALLDQQNVAVSQSNVGEILLDLGDLRGAEQMYKQSLTICEATSNSDLIAHDLEGLGRVLQAQGRLNEARQIESQAVAMFGRGGQSQVVDAYVSLAGILLDLGSSQDAAAAAHDALEQIDRFKLPNRYRSGPEAVLAQVFLAQGKVPDSNKMLDSATTALGQGPTKEGTFLLSTVAARVRSASADRVESVEAAKSLRLIVAETQRTGFVREEFEARLALAKVEIALGDPATGRAHLIALEKAASERGFALISQKAGAILQVRPTSPRGGRERSPDA